jgi:biopolymer transport protein ExbD
VRLAARPPRRRNTIVLTSLVDVMFVLLFFFMLVSNYGDWRSWSLALSNPVDAASGGSLVIEVLGDGRYRLAGQPASIREVDAALHRGPVRAVLVPGTGVSLQQVVDALDTLKPTGAELTLGRAAEAP